MRIIFLFYCSIFFHLHFHFHIGGKREREIERERDKVHLFLVVCVGLFPAIGSRWSRKFGDRGMLRYQASIPSKHDKVAKVPPANEKN